MAEAGKARRRARGRRWVVGVAAAVLALLAWNGVLFGMASVEARSVKRNPETGIIVGAEPRDLGPADSPRAALLVHGYAGSPRDFDGLPERLAERGWRVRVMLLPGHGTRARDLARQTPEGLVQAVKSELAALRAQHDTVVLIGFSMGGALSLWTASEEKVDGLVLAAPYFAVTHRWYYGLHPETWARLLAQPVRWVYKGKLFLQLNRRENADQLIAYGVLPTRSAVVLGRIGARARRPEVLRSIKAPVLLIHSHNDVASSPVEAEKAFRQLGSEDKRIVWLDRSNHHVFWDYDQDRVLDEITAFLVRFER